MTNQALPTRVRIHSHMTQSRFLHVEDSLAIGKVRLFGGSYRKGEGMNAHVSVFVNTADARVIFDALVRGEQGFRYKEYKGTPPRDGRPAVSRVLSIAVKGENVYIELKTGPGKVTDTGAITPDGPAEVVVNVGFKRYEARRMAASVLAYIRAWDVVRMMSNRQMVSPPSPYTLTPPSTDRLANGGSRPNGAPAPTANPSPPNSANSLPSRKRGSHSRNGHARQNGRSVPRQTLLYGDGTPVAADNQTERSTYARYRQAKGSVPPSKHVLLQYYRQQTAV